MKFTRKSFATTQALIALFLPVVIRAEVARVEITRRQDVLGGKAFGEVGAYEKLVGKVYYAVVRRYAAWPRHMAAPG